MFYQSVAQGHANFDSNHVSWVLDYEQFVLLQPQPKVSNTNDL